MNVRKMWAEATRQEHFDTDNTSALAWIWWGLGEPMDDFIRLLETFYKTEHQTYEFTL